MSKKVMIMLESKNEKDVLDGLRSTLGLAVANHYGYACVLNTKLNPFDDYNAENVDWIRDMEGEAYSNVPENVANNGLVAMTIEELGQKLREVDIIVPYGVAK